MQPESKSEAAHANYANPTGGSCVWNRMCMMSALLCENGRVLIVKLWFMVLNLCIGLSEGLYIWHEYQWWMF